ncbi:MAG TPA: universal stress protein [Stellaceae bacterium]|jgi:nucleotide-binding universal stress UspA family protein|nr:universal stress protein [Stellaceae bacterium]
MAIRDILVCLDPTDAGEARLRLAASIARDRQARLAGAYLLSQQIPGAPPYGIGIAAPAAAAAIAPGALVGGIPAPGAPPAAPNPAADLADIIEQRFRAALPSGAQGDDWHLFGTGEGEDLVRLAKSFDLIVCGQASPDYPVASGFAAEDVVLGCARPVLVVPYAGAFAQIGRHVLIAWDGTREAVRAVHDALPLIAAGAAATVISVAAREDEFDRWRPDFERLIRHLEHHGVGAKLEETVRGDISIADLLLSRASDFAADLIVAGAYHHSPMREAWLGGVSRELLQRMTVPVLMSH